LFRAVTRDISSFPVPAVALTLRVTCKNREGRQRVCSVLGVRRKLYFQTIGIFNRIFRVKIQSTVFLRSHRIFHERIFAIGQPRNRLTLLLKKIFLPENISTSRRYDKHTTKTRIRFDVAFFRRGVYIRYDANFKRNLVRRAFFIHAKIEIVPRSVAFVDAARRKRGVIFIFLVKREHTRRCESPTRFHPGMLVYPRLTST